MNTIGVVESFDMIRHMVRQTPKMKIGDPLTGRAPGSLGKWSNIISEYSKINFDRVYYYIVKYILLPIS